MIQRECPQINLPPVDLMAQPPQLVTFAGKFGEGAEITDIQALEVITENNFEHRRCLVRLNALQSWARGVVSE